MLDTNIVSHILKGNDHHAMTRLMALNMDALEISAITAAELFYGLMKRGNPPRLASLISEFLIRVNVISWGQDAAHAYGKLRAGCESEGITLADKDMLIAAHALAQGSTLVSRDNVFSRVPKKLGLRVETWGG
jgi:tRNA(fMet)-specific endonuclease VapC